MHTRQRICEMFCLTQCNTSKANACMTVDLMHRWVKVKLWAFKKQSFLQHNETYFFLQVVSFSTNFPPQQTDSRRPVADASLKSISAKNFVYCCTCLHHNVAQFHLVLICASGKRKSKSRRGIMILLLYLPRLARHPNVTFRRIPH